MLLTQIGSCVCVCHADKTAQFPPSLSLLHRKNRNPANLFTFPKCQEDRGGWRVSAQSWRRFHQNRVWGWTFPFASASVSGAEPGPPVPWKSWTRLPCGGRAASPGRTDARPSGPTRRTHGGRRGWSGASRPGPGLGPGLGLGLAAGAVAGLGPGWAPGRTPTPAARSGGGARGGGARRGFHPRMRIGTFAFPSPPP